MLIVKDFEKLAAHGFKKLSKTVNIWEKIIENDEYANYIAFLVNPFNVSCKENELFIYAYSENVEDDGIDACARIDEVFEMVADGTIEYVKGDK